MDGWQTDIWTDKRRYKGIACPCSKRVQTMRGVDGRRDSISINNGNNNLSFIIIIIIIIIIILLVLKSILDTVQVFPIESMFSQSSRVESSPCFTVCRLDDLDVLLWAKWQSDKVTLQSINQSINQSNFIYRGLQWVPFRPNDWRVHPDAHRLLVLCRASQNEQCYAHHRVILEIFQLHFGKLRWLNWYQTRV